MAMPDNLPFDNAPDIQQEMQWGLEDLLHGKPTSPKLWELLPPGNATEAFQALRDALPGGEPGVRKAFKALCALEAFKWLIAFRNEPIPARPGAEGEQSEATKEEELPRGIHIGKTGKPVFTRMLEADVD